MSCGIYQIRNVKNGKLYIGSSVKIELRFYDHKRLLSQNRHDNPHLQNAWNYYGESSFAFEILELCASDVLREKEQVFIETKRVLDKRHGYNIAPNANLPPMTEETKKRIGDANRGKKPWNVGKHHTGATKHKISQSSKRNNWMKGRTGKRHPKFGHEVTAATREKMRSAKLGKFNNHSSKSVSQYDGDILVAVYPSAREAERQSGIDAKNIAACLKGKRNRAGGFSWKYHEDIS